MQIRPFLFLIIPVLLPLFSCDKDEVRERDYPALRTQAVNNITTEGARFNATLVSGDLESISEYGFVWDNTNNLSLQYSEKIMVNGNPGQESFSCEVTFALEAMEEYYVRPYVKSGDYTVYGEVVKFMSLGSEAPEITDFEPKSAHWGDTITIYGRNFSNQAGTNRVLFGELEGRITNCTKDSLQVIIPGGLTQLSIYIAIEIFGNRSTALEAFNLIVPGKIITIDKTDITWGDTVELTGIFPFSTHVVGFKIENTNAVVLGNNESNIKIIVPNTIAYSDSVTVYLMIDGKKLASPDRVHMVEPCINSITPVSFGWNDTITVYGQFHPNPGNNKILFSNVQAMVLESKKDRIKCIVPYTNSHTTEISGIINNYNVIYPIQISLNGPIITEVSPDKISGNQYIIVKGKYFKEGNTTAKINNNITSVEQVTDSQLMVFVSEELDNGPANLEITVFAKKVQISAAFVISNPKIISISPSMVTYGDIVTIKGEGFNPDVLNVSIKGWQAQIIEASETMIRVVVPDYLSFESPDIMVYTSDRYLYSYNSLHLFPSTILSISPPTAKEGETVTINGNYFNPIRQYNIVYLKSNSTGRTYYANTISGNRNMIEFVVPSLTRDDYSIIVDIQGWTCSSVDVFTCHSPWALIDNMSIGQSYANGIVENGNAWIFGGQNSGNDYQRYSIPEGDPQVLHNCPFYSIMGGVTFNVNNMGYFGLGKNYPDLYTKEFYRFDFTNRTWTKQNDFPGNGRMSAFHFSVGNRCFMGGGLNFQDFWEYDVSGDSWTYKGDYPGGPSGRAIAFAVNDKAYVIDGKMVWEYNTITGAWDRKADFPGNEKYLATGFVIDARIYFGTGCDNYVIYDWIASHADFWRYDPSIDQWQQLKDIPYPRYAAFGVTSDSKGYVGGGKNGYDELTSVLEYDPNFE